MVDRPIVYPGEIPLDTHILMPAQSSMIALGYLAQACLGTGTYADGLACTPTLPASMQVNVGPGTLTALSTIDASAYGTLPADLDPLVKQGINPYGSTSFTLTSPGISGQTINYLIEAQFLEQDGSPVSLPYFNAQNPTQPFTGPNNNQSLQNTQRTQRVGLQLKAGAPAGAGAQQTPSVDAGWVGLYVITVNFGQTTITASSISVYPNAPFITAKIPALAPIFSPALTGVPTVPTAPNGTATTQVASTAFVSGFPHGMQSFRTAGAQTFTVLSGIRKVKVRLWGGGGGGGATSAIAGGGGGGGGYSEGYFTVTEGQVISLTVGAGGAFSGAGGNSSFLACLATGGGAASLGTPGSGGVGSGGGLNINGGGGGFGTTIGGSQIGGAGGTSFGSFFSGYPFISGGNVAGAFPGGGSSGQAGSGTSAGGGGGLVVVEW